MRFKFLDLTRFCAATLADNILQKLSVILPKAAVAIPLYSVVVCPRNKAQPNTPLNSRFGHWIEFEKLPRISESRPTTLNRDEGQGVRPNYLCLSSVLCRCALLQQKSPQNAGEIFVLLGFRLKTYEDGLCGYFRALEGAFRL